MKSESMLLLALRISWPVLGGGWGAWVGFGGCLNLAHNADSFGTIIAQGFYLFFACIGLVTGILVSVVIGWSFEKLLRHFGAGITSAVCAATVLNALVIWQLAGFVKKKYPGLRPPEAKPSVPLTIKRHP